MKKNTVIKPLKKENRLIRWVKNHKKWSISITVLLLLFFIIIMPFILNAVYYTNTPCNFFNVGYDVSSVLNYYSSILTFLGTVTLGIIAVYQNHKAQEKTDEVNKLTLELQKKSMVMAEQNYEKSKLEEAKKNTPKFELKIEGYQGRYMNLHAILKNVAEFIVSNIKSVSFQVIAEDNKLITSSDKASSNASSLIPGQSTRVEFNNDDLSHKKANEFGQINEGINDIILEWKFQCEDSYGHLHYFKAMKYIKDSNNMDAGLWDVEKIG